MHLLSKLVLQAGRLQDCWVMGPAYTDTDVTSVVSCSDYCCAAIANAPQMQALSITV